MEMISCLHIPNNPAKYVGEAFTFLRRNGSVLQVGWSSGDAAKESGHMNISLAVSGEDGDARKTRSCSCIQKDGWKKLDAQKTLILLHRDPKQCCTTAIACTTISHPLCSLLPLPLLAALPSS